MTPEPKEIGHQVKFRNTLVGLFKKGCWHIPEIMASSCLALIGMGLAAVGMRKYIESDGDNREFKFTYYIVRHDDPRACRIKNPVFTQFRG